MAHKTVVTVKVISGYIPPDAEEVEGFCVAGAQSDSEEIICQAERLSAAELRRIQKHGFDNCAERANVL